MALSVTMDDPEAPGTDVVGAYAWIVDTELHHKDDDYMLYVWVHRTAAAAALMPTPEPMAKLTFRQRQVLGGSPPAAMPDVATFDADAAALQAANPGLTPYGAFRAAIYRRLALWSGWRDVGLAE